MVMFSIISMDFFQLEAAQAGYLMSFFGILQMVSGCRTRWAGGLPALPGSQGLADHPPPRFLSSGGAVLHAHLSGVPSTP